MTDFTTATMATCGMYDGAGDFAVTVGVPAKSGVGGGIMGVGGMLLGVPLAAAAYRILRDDVNSRLAEPETEN